MKAGYRTNRFDLREAQRTFLLGSGRLAAAMPGFTGAENIDYR